MSAIYIPAGMYISKKEAAQRRNVNHQTIQQWIQKGWLPSIYIGGAHIIRVDDLDSVKPPEPGRKAAAKDSNGK